MSENPDLSTARAPWHLWVIGIISLLWNAIGAFDYIMTETKNAEYMSNFTPEQLAFFYAIPWWAIACWAIAVWGGLLGSLLLLLRKRAAVTVFMVSFIAMLAVTVQNFLLSNGMEAMGSAGMIAMSAAVFLISPALLLYARSLRGRGVLA